MTDWTQVYDELVVRRKENAALLKALDAAFLALRTIPLSHSIQEVDRLGQATIETIYNNLRDQGVSLPGWW